MICFVARVARASRLLVAISACLAALCASSQSSPSPAPPGQTNESHGQVIFSRSIGEDGQTTTTVGPTVLPAGGSLVAAPAATDGERDAVTFTALNLDVHLHPADHKIMVRAVLTARNDSKAPLAHIPLQISSSLNWEHIRLDGRDIPFTVATLNSDVDHTGQLHEAAFTPAQPLAPGASLKLIATYSGVITQCAQRLLNIGTPDDIALHSDWDEIGENFTGLRGFGNVVWYPVSSAPVILGDGNRVFDEMGEHKLRFSGARFSLRLTSEFPPGRAPTVALINGNPVPLHMIQPSAESGETSGFAIAELDNSTLGFEAPSLFLAIRAPHKAANTTLWALPADEDALPGWVSAAATMTPFLQQWLGPTPRSQLTILDPPDADDAPFETGSLLVTAIHQGNAGQLTGIFAHALTHAWMDSPRAWLSEGIARFMGTLWIEKQTGRQKALEALESGRMALALEEPSSPGVSAGQPLAQAISPAYYRTKAAYVFWMLRDLVGQPALAAAFRAYDPAADAASGLGPNSGSAYFEKLVRQATARDDGSSQSAPASASDLSWFFADWVNSDKGLPDVTIGSVFPSSAAGPPPPTARSVIRWRATNPETGQNLPSSAPASASSADGTGSGTDANNPDANGPDADTWIVAVNLSNSGYAAAEVPVTVSNADTSITQRVVVPARGNATQRILIQGKPTKVQANDGTIPETEASIHITQLTGAGNSSSSSSSQPSSAQQ